MLDIVTAIILGIIQGITEFLPVSSSGHLVIFQRIFGIEGNVLTFDVMLHLATLIAVCAVMRKEIAEMIRKPLSRITYMLIVATIPAAIIGLLFRDAFAGLYESGLSLGFEFLLTGMILWFAESIKSGHKDVNNMSYPDAIFIGVAQSIAIFPAVSRSGLTLAGSLARKLDREFAVKFMLLLSIPSIAGAASVDIYGFIRDGSGAFNEMQGGIGIAAYIAGFLAALISGYFAIRFFVKVFMKSSLKIYSIYVFAIGAFVLIDQLFFGRFFGRFF